LFITGSAVAYAQIATDTIFYNKDWKKTLSFYYSFYRVIEHKDGKLKVEDHYRNGQIQMSGTYTSLVPREIEEGHFTYYTERGIKIRDEYFQEGLLEGEYLNYDTTTGHLVLKVNFKHDKWDGHRIAYYPSGVIYRDEIYMDGVFVSGKCFDEKSKEIKFFPREVVAEYPGGDTALQAFIYSHLIYPEVAKKLAIQGTVRVKFVLGIDGRVEDAGIDQSENIVLNDAALEVVKKLPKFKPAKQEGKPVRFALALPIVFKI
jgi:TonB family protein